MGKFEPVPFSEPEEGDIGDKPTSESFKTSTSSVDAASPQKEPSAHDKVLRSILYDTMIPKLAMNMACNVHGLIRNQSSASREMMQGASRRQDLYPNLYDADMNDQQVNDKLEYYATDNPHKNISAASTSMMSGKKRSLSQVQPQPSSATPTDGGLPTTTSTTKDQTALPTETSSSSSNNNKGDIWGRNPPKEPKTACECKVCGRSVSVSRFAQHLDKCLQLGNTRERGAAQSSSSSSAGGMIMTTTTTSAAAAVAGIR